MQLTEIRDGRIVISSHRTLLRVKKTQYEVNAIMTSEKSASKLRECKFFIIIQPLGNNREQFEI